MNYNEDTTKWINSYINEIDKMFPGLFPYDEIYERIKTGLSCDIIYCELTSRTTGTYNEYKKQISISKDLESDKARDLVIFHELTHVLTRNITDIVAVKDNRYIVEILTTLLETKYANTKYDNNNKKVNGYINNFGEQLYAIYGEKLLEVFLKDPSKLPDIFYALGSKFSSNAKLSTFNNTIRYLEGIKRTFGQVFTESDLKNYTKDFEYQLMVQFEEKLTFNGIKDNLKSLNDLYLLQHYHDYYQIYSLIKNIDESSLLLYPDLLMIYKVKTIDDINELLKSITSGDICNNESSYTVLCLAEKVFGFDNTFLDIPECEQISLEQIEDITDELHINNDRLLDYENFYKEVLNLLLDGKITYEELKGMTFTSELSENKEFLYKLHGSSPSPTEKLYEIIFGKKSNTLSSCLYNKEGLKLIIDDESRHYEQTSLEDLTKLKLEKDDRKTLNKVITILNDNGVSDVYMDLENISSISADLNANHIYVYYFDAENKLIKSKIAPTKAGKFSIIQKSEIEQNGKMPVMSSFDEIVKKNSKG